MRKVILVAALLAMMVVAVLPTLAAAQNNRNDDNNHRHHHNNFNFNRGDSAISQDNEQDADSGDLNQSVNITGGGDNSNQCVGAQQAGNTGNAQNQIGILQYGSEADDFEFDDTGAKIDVSPTNTTSCNQQVNQAASASG